jgi:tetratricopeptide (TPR) repeat protein
MRRVVIIIILLLFGGFSAGCDRMNRALINQGKEALKQGNSAVAVRNAKQVLQKSPHNLFAKQLLKKVRTQLLREARENMEAKRYKEAMEKADTLLNDIDPQHEEAKALRAEAKKHLLLADARKALEKNDPISVVGALRMTKQALQLDPEFAEAKELYAEANEKAQLKIANLMNTAKQLIEQQQFEKLESLAQEILAIDSKNQQAARLLREAHARKLDRDKKKHLAMAKEFYEKNVYESALANAEKVLKVDPRSVEARKLIEDIKAEMTKPTIRLTGFTQIKGLEIAHIEMSDTRERFMVKEGEEFGDHFKLTLIDLDAKEVVVTFTKTGTQQVLTTGSE